MRLPTSQPQSKNRFLNRIIVLGLFSGILITTLIWLRVPNKIITPLSWFSLGLIGLGSFLYLHQPIAPRPRWIIILAALAAASLVFLFPELFGPACGGMPRAFALNCPPECRIKECTKWVAGPSPECPNPGSGGGCCLSYATTCDPDCETKPPQDQPPTISGSVTCSQWGKNGWCIKNATLELNAIEPQGKLLQVSGDVGGISFSCPTGSGAVNCTVPLPEGKVTVNYIATSITELTDSGSKTYKFDATSPQINGTFNGITGTNTWYISLVDVNASASDPGAGSGIEVFEYNLNSAGWKTYMGPLSLSDGVHNLGLRASDLAGNSVETDQTFQIDTITPTLNLSVNGATGSNGWFTSNIQIDTTTSDAGSGVSSLEYELDSAGWTTYSGTLELTDGSHNLNLRVTDNAGNITEGTQNFSVDTLAPTIDSLVTGTEGTNGWYISDVQINASADDSGSGLSLLEVGVNGGAYNVYSEPITFGDGLHSYQFRATDSAGNLTESTLQQVRVDTILPVIDLPKSWEVGQTITFKLQDDGSGLGSVRVVVEDEDERFPKVAWEKKLKSYKFTGEIDWNGRFKDGQLAPQGGEYYAWVKVSDAAGNERIQAGQIVVPPISIVEELLLPSGNQTDELVSGAEASGTIEEQPVHQTSAPGKATPSELSAISAPPPINFGGESNGAAQPSSAQAGISSFNAGGQSTTPISSGQSSLLWGATATAAIGAFAAEATRRKAARRAANAKINQARKLKQQAYALSQQLKKQKDAIDQALRNQTAYAHVLGRKEVDIEKELRSNLTKVQAEGEALDRAKQKAYDIYRKQEVAAQKKIEPQKAEWWENTKSSVWENILSPLNSNIYQPYVKPVLEKTSDIVKNEISQINNKIIQPYIKPIIDYDIQRATDKFTWVNENIVQPHINPSLEKIIQAATNAATWLNEKIYMPYVEPLMEDAVHKIGEGIAWANENLYQPRLKPFVDSFIGNVYQPYISPLVEKGTEQLADKGSWINKNFYQPFIQPIVADIDQYIYQPYLKPTQDKATDWWEKTWDKYGEWVHGALDTVGFIPGLGDIADGINGLIYLGEGRYLEASISALAMVPLIGDLGKGGKLATKIGNELVEEAVEKVIKEATEEFVEEALEVVTEKVVREVGEEIGEEIVEKVAIETVEEAAEKVLLESGGEILEKSTREVVEETTEKVFRETSEELTNKSSGNILENLTKKTIQETSDELVENVSQKVTEKTTKEVTDAIAKKVVDENIDLALNTSATKISSTIVDEAVEETAELLNEEIVDQVLKNITEGKVTKLPVDLADNLTDESADKLAEKISKEFNVPQEKVWISTETGSLYISSPPSEGFILAKQLAETDPKNVEEVRNILRQVAELTSRGSGKHVVLGPFQPGGGFIQKALDTDGIFWDVGDELWEELQKTGIDMFEANDQFLQLHVSNGIERFDVIETNVNKAINDFNSSGPIDWNDLKYTEKEVIDLASMPNIQYQLVDNSWVRIDLIK